MILEGAFDGPVTRYARRASGPALAVARALR